MGSSRALFIPLLDDKPTLKMRVANSQNEC
nr:MAG TPA: hypothetical protein [Caudoviricetes sp.]